MKLDQSHLPYLSRRGHHTAVQGNVCRPDNKASCRRWLMSSKNAAHSRNAFLQRRIYVSHKQVKTNYWSSCCCFFSDISRTKNRPYYPITPATKSFLNTQLPFYSSMCLPAVGCINVYIYLNVCPLNGWIQEENIWWRRGVIFWKLLQQDRMFQRQVNKYSALEQGSQNKHIITRIQPGNNPMHFQIWMLADVNSRDGDDDNGVDNFA